MRADQRAPRRRVARAAFAQSGAVGLLRLQGRTLHHHRLDLADERQARPGEGRGVVALGQDRAGEAADAFGAGRRDGDAEFGGLALHRVEPRAVPATFLQELVAAAQGALEPADPRAMLGVDGEHEAVEKLAPLASGAAEQGVHRRRQPDEAQVIGKGARGADGGAVDAVEPLAPFEPEAHRADLALLLHFDGDREAAGAVEAGAIGKLRPPEAASGREQRKRLQKVGLAGAVLADEGDETGLESHVERRIGAEIAQDQPAHAGRAAGGEIGRHGHGARFGTAAPA